jgi:hypothetical protein
VTKAEDMRADGLAVVYEVRCGPTVKALRCLVKQRRRFERLNQVTPSAYPFSFAGFA